jgi:hypothetical protein
MSSDEQVGKMFKSLIVSAVQESVATAIRSDEKLFAHRLEHELENAGTSWTSAEEQMLNSEIRTAIQVIATRHGRSYHAIRARLMKIADGTTS